MLNECHEVRGPTPGVRKEIFFSTPQALDISSEGVMGAAFSHRDRNHFYEAPTIVLVQHGLPGIDWRKEVEKKVQAVIENNPELSVLSTMPIGLKPTEENFGVPADKLKDITFDHPDFFGRTFNLETYQQQLYMAFKSLKGLNPDASIRLVGQSYGAAALAYALARLCKEMWFTGLPTKATFLSPFIKIGPSEWEKTALNIENKAVERMGTSDDPWSTLGEILDQCREHYIINKGANLIEEHRRAFGPQFFHFLNTHLPVVSSHCCEIEVFRGSQDPYINQSHSELLAGYLRMTRESIKREVDDDHSLLRELEWEKILCA